MDLTRTNDLQTTCIYTNQREKKFNLFGSAMLSFAILMLFFWHYTTENTIYFWGGLASLILVWLILDWSRMLLVIGTLVPNIMMIKFVGNSSAILGYFLLLTAGKYFLMRGFSLKIPVVFILHVCSVCITAGIYQQWSGMLNPLIRSMVFFLFICMISQEKIFLNHSYQECLIKSYLLGLLLAAGFGMITYSLAGGGHSILSGIRADRNYFSSMIISGLCIIPLYMSARKKVGIKESLVAMVLIYGGLLTYSRTFFIALVFVGLLWVVKLNIWHHGKQIFAILITIVVLGVVFKTQISEVLERLFQRFTTDDVYGGNGRLDAWIYFITLTISTPLRFLFGNGKAIEYVNAGAVSVVEHNTFIELFSTYGFVGFITSAMSYSVIIKKFVGGIKKFSSIDILTWIPFVICYSGISAMYSDAFNFQFFITLVAIKYAQEKLEIKTKR